jgi:FkbM family methyltransferase
VTAGDRRPTPPEPRAARAARTAHLLGRFLLSGAVRRLPPAVAAPLRRPPPVPLPFAGPVLHAVRETLRRGGLPRRVRTFVLPDNPAVRFVNADSLVLQRLYWFGEQGWEPELLPWWRHFCRRSATVVELGTNVGYFAVQGALAAPAARYVAVEPHPVSAQVCRANLALNGIDSVEVVAAAATADPTESPVALSVPWEQLGTPTVAFLAGGSELPPRMARRAGTAIEVPAVDVRPLLAAADLVKLDVEGQEHALLAAGWAQLRARRPTVFVEVLPGTPRLRAVLARMCTELGYRCYAPGRERLVPLPASRLPQVDLPAEFGCHDVILCADADPAGRPGHPATSATAVSSRSTSPSSV